MTITSTESKLMDPEVTPLSDKEQMLVHDTMTEFFNTARALGVPVSGDDRSAKVEAAVIQCIVSSRK
jgi:hypothetical protein